MRLRECLCCATRTRPSAQGCGTDFGSHTTTMAGAKRLIAAVLSGGERSPGSHFVRMERGVPGQAHHGEDLDEVRFQAEGLDLLATLGCRDHQLDDQSNRSEEHTSEFQ